MKILEGSCAVLYTTAPPGKSYMRTAERSIDFLPHEFNDNVYSATRCRTETVILSCPNNTFIKQIEWGGKWGEVTSLMLYCSKAENIKADAVLEFQDPETLVKHHKCVAVVGLDFYFHVETGSYYLHKVACARSEFTDGTLKCPRGQVMTGLEIEQEDLCKILKFRK